MTNIMLLSSSQPWILSDELQTGIRFFLFSIDMQKSTVTIGS